MQSQMIHLIILQNKMVKKSLVHRQLSLQTLEHPNITLRSINFATFRSLEIDRASMMVKKGV